MRYIQPDHFVDCLVIRADDTPAQKAVKGLNLVRRPGTGVRLHQCLCLFNVMLTMGFRRSKLGA